MMVLRETLKSRKTGNVRTILFAPRNRLIISCCRARRSVKRRSGSEDQSFCTFEGLQRGDGFAEATFGQAISTVLSSSSRSTGFPRCNERSAAQGGQFLPDL